MSFDETIANRTREIIAITHDNVEERKMFGGICFMVNDKMCLGVLGARLMVRLHPEKQEELLELDGCSPMDFTGKPMKGYVYVDNEVLNTDKKLKFWIDIALEYNKIAKASKKKI
jgi:TfoX/Sxy family transcriptional regulator of competence genes